MKEITKNIPDRFQENHLRIFVTEADKIEENFLKQILEKSRQDHVMQFEGHEDAGGRFKDVQSYREWAAKGRTIFILTDETGKDLGGILWFGKRNNPNIDPKYTLTFGIRLYEGFVGKGLSKPLLIIGHEELGNYFDDKYIWLDFASENIIAGKAYSSFGYEILNEADGRVIMGKKL